MSYTSIACPAFRSARALLLASAVAVAAASALASPYSDINAAAAANSITVHKLRGGVSMLEGSGGNIGVLAGSEGLIMVDTGIAVSQAKIVAALGSISPSKLRYAILTHWHWDHADGSGWVRKTGATIIAHKGAVERLKQTNRIVEWEHTFAPVPASDLPNEIITNDKTMKVNGETVLIRHYEAGHTDGDVSVYFEMADVLQTGDTFWNGVYPFIDHVTGGSIDGAIAAANANLKMAKDTTLVIPGHGPKGNRTQLIEFRDMLVAVRGRVAKLKAEGKTLEQTVAAKPTASFDSKWGKSVISGELFTALVYRGV